MPTVVCCICGLPCLRRAAEVRHGGSWLSSCCALVNWSAQSANEIATAVGDITPAGNLVVAEQEYAANWGTFHSLPAHVQALGVRQPHYIAHSTCWTLLHTQIPSSKLCLLPGVFEQYWEQTHYAWTTVKRKWGTAAALEASSDAYVTAMDVQVLECWENGRFHEDQLSQDITAPPAAALVDTAWAPQTPPLSEALAPPHSVDIHLPHSNIPSGLSCLPPEVLEHVVQHLDHRSALALFSSSRELSQLPKQLSQQAWERLCRSSFPMVDWDLESCSGRKYESRIFVHLQHTDSDVDSLLEAAHGIEAAGRADQGRAVSNNSAVEAGASEFVEEVLHPNGPGGATHLGFKRPRGPDRDWAAAFYACLKSDRSRLLRVVKFLSKAVAPVRWDPCATRCFHRLPSSIRPRVRAMIEDYVTDRGLYSITQELYYAAADQLDVYSMLPISVQA